MRYLIGIAYLGIPLAFLCHFWFARGKHWEPIATFVAAGIGIIPLAQLMGESTEHLSERSGPTWGGLLNATFGNAAELIIGVIALTKGLNDMAKASLTGSILGNLLLVAGGAMVVGGWKRESQTFNRKAAETNAGLLALSVAMMVIPAIFHYTAETHQDTAIHEHMNAVSIGTSVVLLIVYGLAMLFSLRTHRHVLSPEPPASDEDKLGVSALTPGWSVTRSVTMLLVASIGVAIVSELLVGAAERLAGTLGWNHVFIGVILLAIIGNAAEHSTAMYLAARDDMDTAMTITFQSSIQIALFVVPLLVIVSAFLVGFGVQGTSHLDLVFSPLEVVGVMITVLIVIILGINGESNWFEGALLLALYAILGIAFFYIPAAAPHE